MYVKVYDGKYVLGFKLKVLIYICICIMEIVMEKMFLLCL